MAPDYIDLKIDVDRHANGKAVADRLTGGESKGFPWSVVLDGDGEPLVTSDRPGGGNIGCPVTEEECAWFMQMIERTAQRMDEAARATIAAELEDHAEALRR